MTTLEIILTAIIWISYGVFNSWQHDCFENSGNGTKELFIYFNILFSPIALLIRIIRGIFYWKGNYD